MKHLHHRLSKCPFFLTTSSTVRISIIREPWFGWRTSNSRSVAWESNVFAIRSSPLWFSCLLVHYFLEAVFHQTLSFLPFSCLKNRLDKEFFSFILLIQKIGWTKWQFFLELFLFFRTNVLINLLYIFICSMGMQFNTLRAEQYNGIRLNQIGSFGHGTNRQFQVITIICMNYSLTARA